jgi:hypothetical protein
MKVLFLVAAFLSGMLFSVPVNAQTFTEILGRPTDKSITISVLFSQAVHVFFDYGTAPGNYTQLTSVVLSSPDTPVVMDFKPLLPNTRYYYRTAYLPVGQTVFKTSAEHTFHTQRTPGSTFRFDIEADEHLYDKKGIRNMYNVTLQNQAKDSADFLLSLGDIFGDDHTPTTTTSADMDALHKDYLQYLGTVCHSMPFFTCLGNHEGENGYYLNQTPPNNIGVYGTLWRKFYYPNPYPNDFYSGNMVSEDYGIGLPENYYAWTWGDALFVVLDVYRECDVNEKPQKWDWTLGSTQFNWLKNTLETSTAKYKFVFAHHTRGQGRGGKTTATGFEWGGYDAGNYKFDTYRPGWGMPIHQLMVANGVNVFFQGHDHLFAKESLDGLVYQEVPMAADSTYQIGVLANADAYTDLTMDGTGHMRVTVTPSCVTVDYIRAYLPADTVGGLHHNREIAYSYTIGSCATATENLQANDPDAFSVFPNPARDVLLVQFKTAARFDRRIALMDLQGKIVQTQVMGMGDSVGRLELGGVPAGVYVVKVADGRGTKAVKVVVK